MRARFLAVATFVILITSQASLAQTIAETASSWGLLGTWRVNCGAAPSRAMGEQRWVVRGGKLFNDRDFGDLKDSTRVTSATRKPDGSLDIVLSQLRMSFIKGSDGRIRVVSNRAIDSGLQPIKMESIC